MRFPSKVTSYNDSILSKFPVIIKELATEDLTPEKLYVQIKNMFVDVNEFLDVLTCLFAINEIVLIDEEVLHYVKKY